MSDRDPADEGEDSTDDETRDEARDDPAPLDDLANEVRERRERRERRESEAGIDPDGEEDLFESVDVADVDRETVWEAFAEGETEPETEVGLGAEVESVGSESGPVEDHVVPKSEFCQRCPHFTDPPEAACTHEGTTIVEVVDSERFRVRNCPIVAEQRDDEFATLE